MRSSRRTVFTLALVGGLAVSLLTGTPASAGTTLERALVTKINATRKAHGLRALPARVGLTQRAHRHSLAMARRHTMYHSNLSRVCCFRSVGENVAYNATVTRIHRSLMASPGHRANLLSRKWRGIGVGVVRSGGRLWVTEIFRQPR